MNLQAKMAMGLLTLRDTLNPYMLRAVRPMQYSATRSIGNPVDLQTGRSLTQLGPNLKETMD